MYCRLAFVDNEIIAQGLDVDNSTIYSNPNSFACGEDSQFSQLIELVKQKFVAVVHIDQDKLLGGKGRDETR